MNETELSPCPFCGSKKMEYVTELSGGGGKLYAVLCAECFSSGAGYGSKNEAIAAWNRRAENKEE
jgi:Lar family restriction alleviation protein